LLILIVLSGCCVHFPQSLEFLGISLTFFLPYFSSYHNYSLLFIPMSDSASTTSKTESIPSEFRIAKKWDDIIENSVVNVSTGLIVAGVASMVLFSK
jgi:hypothetical protein